MGLTSQPVFDPLIGSKVGRYLIQARVGEGGMGVVYRAEQTPLGRPVALKVIHSALASDAKVVSRFLREAKISCQLTNPHTVTVFDFDHVDGVLYLAMELLQGESLHERLCRGPVEPIRAAEIAAQVCRSLVEAHKKGIIHRDLKPDNIFLGTADDGTLLAKVLDYGLARVMVGDEGARGLPSTTLTQVGTIVGTPIYMSPEQARGKKLDARTDLYSMGVVLFEMLAGVAPFVDEDAVVVLGKHIRDPVPRIADVGSRVAPPPALQVVVDKLLEKEASKRPPDAQWVFQELRAYLASTISVAGFRPPVMDETSSPGRVLPVLLPATSARAGVAQGESGVQARVDDPEIVDEWEDTAAGAATQARHPEAQAPMTPLESEPTILMPSGPTPALDPPAQSAGSGTTPWYLASPGQSLEVTRASRRVPRAALVVGAVGVVALAAVALAIGLGGGAAPIAAVDPPNPAAQPPTPAPPLPANTGPLPGAGLAAPAEPLLPTGTAPPLEPPTPAGFEPHSGRWTGTFTSSTLGAIELNHSGSNVNGTFGASGLLTGRPEGHVLRYRWTQGDLAGRGVVRAYVSIRSRRVRLVGTWGEGDDASRHPWTAEMRTGPRVVRKNRPSGGSGLQYGSGDIFGPQRPRTPPRKNR